MRNFIITILAVAAVLWLLGKGLLGDYEETATQQYEEAMDKVVYPDPGREVWGWDYDKNTYIYKDQVPDRQKFNDALQPDAQPDFYVQPMDKTPSQVQPPEFLWIDGKKYRIRYRSNGVMELEEQ